MKKIIVLTLLLSGCNGTGFPKDSACMMWINEICHCRGNSAKTIWWINGPVSEHAMLEACEPKRW